LLFEPDPLGFDLPLSNKITPAKAENILLAEREGFEPSIEFPLYHLSKMAH
jgi:hypothetical protein